MESDSENKSRIKGIVTDLAATAIVAALCLAFYLPETGALESRYMYYPDCFERAATLVNPEYAGERYRTSAESMRPFMTLCARPILAFFKDDAGAAVGVLHTGLALIAGLLTYWALRLFFTPAAGLYITLLLMFDRCLTPLARGLGMMGALLLAPLLLIILHNLTRTQNRSASRGAKIRAMIGTAAAGGVILLLGGHETVYSVAFLVGGGVLYAIVWGARRLRLGKQASGLSLYTLGSFAGALAAGVTLSAILYYGIPAEQRHDDFLSVLTQQHYRVGAGYDVKQELAHPASRLEFWKATFYDGQYNDDYGAWHRNTFMYPGAGFNGVIPIVVIPGFLIGLVLWIWRLLRIFGPRGDRESDARYSSMALFNAVLIAVFVGVALVSSDPKPTRYSPCVLAIYALSAAGYAFTFERLAMIAKRAERPRAWGGIAAWALLIAVAAPLSMRLHKNYVDLQRYCEVFRFEITTYGLPPLLELAQNEYGDRPTYFVARRWLGPDVGLLLQYKRPERMTFMRRAVFDRPNTRANIPDDAIVFLREDVDGESMWRHGAAAEFK